MGRSLYIPMSWKTPMGMRTPMSWKGPIWKGPMLILKTPLSTKLEAVLRPPPRPPLLGPRPEEGLSADKSYPLEEGAARVPGKPGREHP